MTELSSDSIFNPIDAAPTQTNPICRSVIETKSGKKIQLVLARQSIDMMVAARLVKKISLRTFNVVVFESVQLSEGTGVADSTVTFGGIRFLNCLSISVRQQFSLRRSFTSRGAQQSFC